VSKPGRITAPGFVLPAQKEALRHCTNNDVSGQMTLGERIAGAGHLGGGQPAAEKSPVNFLLFTGSANFALLKVVLGLGWPTNLYACATRPGIKPGVFRSMLRWSRGDGRRARGSVAGNEDDQARFRRVVLPHLSDAYALARWIVGNATDAEDVVQDACLRAFRGINGFAGGNARAWLLTVTRHAAFTWLGKNRPAAMVGVDDLEEVERKELDRGWPMEASETPEAALIAKADANRLEAAIAQLPVPFREALVLRDVQGLEYREIAEVIKAPIGTVMSRLARARNRLIAGIAAQEKVGEGVGKT
jgi:RNA polymerase sigma factor (sigma-70 family)